MKDNLILASLITIGDELLIGQTIDTNSAWMATELNKVGIHVKRRVAVGDIVIIIGYGFMDFEEAKSFKPTLVFPNEETNLID